jgi:hypothetical protein
MKETSSHILNRKYRHPFMVNLFGNGFRLLALVSLVIIGAGTPVRAFSAETEVRATVERVFQNLKDKNYEALYDTLPAGSRSRITRERFASSLRRTQDNYALDRMEVGNTKVAGNFALVDTVLYGRLLKPLDLEGKIVVQQYLVREDGKWKVATGDNATIQRFLKTNPTFARQFRIRPPRVFVKKDGGWVEFAPPRNGARNP